MLAQELVKRINNRTLSAIKNSWNLLNYQIYNSYFSQNFSELFFFDTFGYLLRTTTQKMKFSIQDFFSKWDQIRSFLWIWSHLLKKFLMENFTFCAVKPAKYRVS